MKPEDFSDESIMADEIAAVNPGESFVERESTLKYYRKNYWDPSLFTHSNLGQWQDMGSKTLWKNANERAKKLLKEHTYRIDSDRKRELDRIYNIAEKDEKLAKSRQY